MGVPIVKFESLLGSYVERGLFTATASALFDALGLDPIRDGAFWWKFHCQRVAGKAKGSVTLTAAEKQTIERICGPMMEVLEYE
jgi:hypothetical protein